MLTFRGTMGYRVPMHEGGQGSEGYGVLPGIRSWAAVTENQAKLPFGLAGGLNRTHSMKHYQNGDWICPSIQGFTDYIENC